MQFAPRPYQTLIGEFILDHPRCNVWAGMGMGKTTASIAIFDTLRIFGEADRALVIAPKRVAVSTWPNEIEKWRESFGHLKVVAAVGTAAQRLAAIKSGADITCINYENLTWLVETVGEHWPWDMVIADEATRVKGLRITLQTSSKGKQFVTGQGSVRAKALAKVAFTKVRRWVNLTGSPAPNGVQDIWGQMWFIDAGKRLGSSFTAYTNRWFRQVPTSAGFTQLEPLKFAQQQIEDAIRDVTITIEAKDWFDIKQPIERVIEVDLPPKARAIYDDMERKFFAEIDIHGVEAFNLAGRSNKLLQIASGACIVDSDSKQWVAIHDEKLDALRSIVEETNGEPLLVAYQFVSERDRILKAFPKARTLDNDPTTETRFREGKIPMLVVHPACLHSSTQVLTEARGWVAITDVLPDERVYDGVEFVSHGGCSYSGFSPVIEVFGILMTHQHKLLIANEWKEAVDVGDSSDFREKARYTYKGDDEYLVTMLTLRGNFGNTFTKCNKAQQAKPNSLQKVYRNYFSPSNEHVYLEQLEGYEVPSKGCVGQELRRAWDWNVPILGKFRYFLRRYARNLLGWCNFGAGECERPLFQRELHMGKSDGPTSQQTHESETYIPRCATTPCGALPENGNREVHVNCANEQRDDARGSCVRRTAIRLRDKGSCDQWEQVYDLINCGPRNRFLIKNSDNEVFISHNSAGHGLNLQQSCRILVDFSTGWNLEYDEQVIERIGPTRQLQSGFDRAVFRYRLVTRNTIEALSVIPRLKTKATVQDALKTAMKVRHESN